MKKTVALVVGLGMVVMASGCATQGGMTYIGPISYLHAKSCDKAKMARAVAAKAPTVVQRDALIQAVNMSRGPNEIAAGLSLNVTELFSGDYTTGEVVSQAVAALPDLAIYAAGAYGVKQAVSGGTSTKQVTVYQVTNNGNGNNNNINGGNGNQQNNSASDGAANGDVKVKP